MSSWLWGVPICSTPRRGVRCERGLCCNAHVLTPHAADTCLKHGLELAQLWPFLPPERVWVPARCKTMLAKSLALLVWGVFVPCLVKCDHSQSTGSSDRLCSALCQVPAKFCWESGLASAFGQRLSRAVIILPGNFTATS